MKRLVLIEWIIILWALISLVPVGLHYQAVWYRIYLVLVLIALLWVTRNRLQRTRAGAAESQRQHDEMMRRDPRNRL
jgi:hypothetical protein